jgi:glycosyltransferase involved in cell wall biosynthesis
MISSPVQPTAILDLRCLQDPDYARRGVGRHALALVREAPAGLRLEGIIDPDLPPLIEEARALLAAVHPNAYAASRRGQPACFVSLSPMTHDPLFAARLLADDRITRVAVVYDFIPHREPDRYLPGPAQRLGYALCLRWLARCDLFAPISVSAADDLVQLLNVPRDAVVITGAPVDASFARAQQVRAGRPARHVLVVGGGDPRKNPEVVIRAHARCRLMQEGEGIPLVIVGNYGNEGAAAFRELAVASGGRRELVQVPGHLPEAELLEAYGLARAIVCPSRDEGFSLPVVEGMAAELPCLASDIPAQRELVADAEQRFAPDDDATLAELLKRVVVDADWRRDILTRQAATWPRFQAREVGRRFWNGVLERLGTRPAAPAVTSGRKPRVALLSPLPPDRSGVADYTSASCAWLGRLVDLHVFTETRKPTPLPGAASVAPLSAMPHLLQTFDRVISVAGNSHFHLKIIDQLRRFGAACIAHDARMLSYYLILRGPERARAVAEKELGRPVSESELHGWLADENTMEALFLGELAESASPIIVHSPITARFLRERHGVSPVYLPFSVYRPWSATDLTPDKRKAARVRLGLSEHEVAIVTLGFVHETKAPEECIWALELLRGWGVPATLHFVGSTAAMSDAGAAYRALASRLGLRDHVRFAEGDYISEEVYRDYLAGADLAIQLRTYGLGGLSGALLDCAAAGVPTVANDALAEAVRIPPGYTRRVPNALSPVLIAEALLDLLQSRATVARREEERLAFSEERSLEAYAHGLCRALELDLMPRRARQVAA